jgi:hypothetical protein
MALRCSITVVRLGLADTFYVDLFCFAKLSTMTALSHGPTLLFDFIERPVGVLTCTGAMPFYARFAAEKLSVGRHVGSLG